MIFKRKKKDNSQRLVDVVERKHETGYLFADVVNDLGESAETIRTGPKKTLMAYGYARRTAAAALYVQGLIEEDLFDHACSIFKSLQMQTEGSVEFQEAASADAIAFMQTYNPIISKFMVIKINDIAMNYEAPSTTMTDQQLFTSVLETAHMEQQSIKAEDETHDKDQLVPVIEQQIEPNSRCLDRPEYQEELREYFSQLRELAEQPSEKTSRVRIMPVDGSNWSWEFEFSDRESDLANEVIYNLYCYTQGWTMASAFAISKSSDQIENDCDIPF